MNYSQVRMVGCGKMGSALLVNWIKSASTFAICDPLLKTVPTGARLARGVDDLAQHRCDAIIIAITPQLIDKLMPDYVSALAPGGSVLSIAAGCSLARIKAVTNDVPALRVMPKLPAAVGQGVSAICASDDATKEHLAHCRSLMERTGIAIAVEDEDQIDRFTAVAGSGPGYVLEFARAYVEAVMDLGFGGQTARAMVLDTIGGTVEMARTSDEYLATLRNSVTSKGGTTAAGLDAFNGDGTISERLNATLRAAHVRALELK